MNRHYKGYTVTKRASGNFQIKVSMKGKSYYKTFHGDKSLSDSKQYKQAEMAAMKFRSELEGGITTIVPTFREFSDEFIHMKAVQGVRSNTILFYKNIFMRLNEEFGDMKLNEVTPAKLNYFYDKLVNMSKNVSDSCICKGDFLKNYLTSNKLGYQKTAEKAGIARNVLYNMLKGTKVSKTSADKICEALNLRFDDYFFLVSNNSTIKPKFIKEHISVLHSMFKEAYKMRYVSFNPVDASDVPNISMSHDINYYQPDEITHIFECLNDEPLKWQVIISLFIITGCRRGEIVGLTWDSVLWNQNMLHIDSQVLYNEDDGLYEQEGNKNIDEKYVQVDQVTMDMFKQYHDELLQNYIDLGLTECDMAKFCFPQDSKPEKPMYPTSINSHLAKFSEKHGIRRINPHAFRHSLASALIADGVDEYSVARQLGHKQVSTTRAIYTHEIKKHQAEVAERIPVIYKRTKS